MKDASRNPFIYYNDLLTGARSRSFIIDEYVSKVVFFRLLGYATETRAASQSFLDLSHFQRRWSLVCIHWRAKWRERWDGNYMCQSINCDLRFEHVAGRCWTSKSFQQSSAVWSCGKPPRLLICCHCSFDMHEANTPSFCRPGPELTLRSCLQCSARGRKSRIRRVFIPILYNALHVWAHLIWSEKNRCLNKILCRTW